MSNLRVPYLTSRLQGFGASIFAEMTQLARQHDAVNLGQGFPDFDAPTFLKDAAARAIAGGDNQYCPPNGLPELQDAIAAHQLRHWNLHYDPRSEVTIFSGATEAIHVALQAICEAGDEVILFAPFYDSYRACISQVGAQAKVVNLHDPDFTFDPLELRAAVGPKTRAIMLNTPHNPTGKVFSPTELQQIADVCLEFDLLAITDEVYEHLVYDGRHCSLASLEGMRDRTILISSAGKTFSVTGWKVGHTCASPALTLALRTVHQFVVFCTPPAFQRALVTGYQSDASYFTTLRAEYRARRDLLASGLATTGLRVLPTAGTYFITTDIRPLGFDDDVKFCKHLVQKYRVAAIPNSAFYWPHDTCRHLVRWAFCKRDETLKRALEQLSTLRA